MDITRGIILDIDIDAVIGINEVNLSGRQNRWRASFSIVPQSQVEEDFLHHRRILYPRNYVHHSPALGTCERVVKINLGDEPRPGRPAALGGFIILLFDDLTGLGLLTSLSDATALVGVMESRPSSSMTGKPGEVSSGAGTRDGRNPVLLWADKSKEPSSTGKN